MSDREGAGSPTPASGGDASSSTGGFPQPGGYPVPPPPAVPPTPAAGPSSADPAPSSYPSAPPVPSPAPSAYPAPPVGYPSVAPAEYPAAGPPPGYAPAPPYPYPSQPAYGPPPPPGAPPTYPGYPGWPPPGPPPSRGRLGLIVGIVAAVVVLLAGGLTVVLLAWSANSPRASLENWFEAARAGDIAEVRSLTCAQYAEEEFDPELLTGLTWEIHDIEQVDARLAEATVTVRTTWDVTVERWAIVKEDGAWKVCGPVEQLDRA